MKSKVCASFKLQTHNKTRFVNNGEACDLPWKSQLKIKSSLSTTMRHVCLIFKPKEKIGFLHKDEICASHSKQKFRKL